MTIDNILNKLRYKQEIDIPRSDLIMLSLALLKEADLLETNNTGAPGKSAIEFLLNQKYKIIENPDISDLIRDTILKEIDSVINKVVAKYHIKRKGKNFYFDESFESLEIAITAPDKILPNPNADQLLANIYASQVELETLRIQLTRTNLQNLSQTMLVKQAILDKESEIKDMKKRLRLFSYFDSLSDQNDLYRRSLGEAKKEIATGTIIGGLVGGKIASDKFKKEVKFNDKQKKFQQAHKDLSSIKKDTQGLSLEAKHLYDTGLSPNKDKKFNKLVNKMKQNLKDYRSVKKQYDKGAKQVVSLSRESLKKGLKGGVKGAAIGAGLGLGVAAIHKAKNESLVEKLNNRLQILEEKSKIIKTFKDYKGTYQLDTLNNRVKNFLSPKINNRITIPAALLVGGVGISLLLKKAKEKGAVKTIGSIKKAINRVQKSNKYTNTQKIKIKNSGQLAINKINQVFKKK